MALKGEEENPENAEEDFEPKDMRQQIKIVGRTISCHRCQDSKEMASFYCACGSFLCAFHVGGHKCLVTASMQYGREVLAGLR
jgi:late competence protein required for DNA uptake (superfamily II DNA/RNA helicase)